MKYGRDQLPHLIRDEYLGEMLTVSTKAPFRTDYLLLNPRIVFEDGQSGGLGLLDGVIPEPIEIAIFPGDDATHPRNASD